MSDPKAPTYSVVSVRDLSVAMKASATSTFAGNKMKKNDSAVWDQTVVAIMESIDIAEVNRDTSKEGVQKLGTELKSIIATQILTSTVIPEDGKGRKGESIKVCGKDGLPKWSSWDQTRRIWAYIGDVAKIISFGQEDLLYPESMKVCARCDVLDKCKIQEVPIKAVERLSEALQDNLDVITDPLEVLTSHNLVSNLTVNNLSAKAEIEMYLKKIDACLAGCSQDDKDALAPQVASLAPHFLS